MAMQFSIDLISFYWALAGLILGGGLSLLITRSKTARLESDCARSEAQVAELTTELAHLEAIRRELLTGNGVLEQRLVGQQAQYEAQLKLLQEAKQSLSQEFENLANRIFEDKQAKFTVQNKEAL